MTLNQTALALAVTTLVASTASAAVLTAVRDTYVDSDNGTTNFGSDATLVVETGNNAADRSRITFVSFDISSVTLPVTSATLDVLKLSGRGDRATGYFGITDESFDGFDEMSLTYDSNPLLPPGAGGDGRSLIGETDLGLLQSSTADRRDGIDLYTSFDDTADGVDELVDFINSDTNGIVTFAIHSEQENGNVFTFFSRESTDAAAVAPTLTLTVVPEPASAAAIGLLGLVGLRRRR